MIEKAKERLQSFGYEWKNEDEAVLAFSVQKVENTIKNDCNVSKIPNGLINIAIDMAVGEFHLVKKTCSPDDIAGLDLSTAVKQIQEGDTNVTFAAGEGSLTAEQRLENLINYLLTYGKGEFVHYRRLIW